WNANVTGTFTVSANVAPTTVSVSASGYTLGSSTTFSGRATDSNGNLKWIHFYVNGPGLPGWNHIGSQSASGNDATRTQSWTAPTAGSYGVHIRAEDTLGVYDSNGNVATYFNITPPAPPAPTATSASSVGSSSFTANWNSVSGATSYRLDVSTSSGFGSYVS